MPHANLLPHTLATARLLACFSGLFHDIGKLTSHFQGKLKKTLPERDAISHEWISTWILAYMLDHNALHWDGFLAAWHEWEQGVEGVERLARNGHTWRPFDALNSFQSAVLMVVATHHRLFSVDNRREKDTKDITPPDAKILAPDRNHLSDISWTMDRTIWHRAENWNQGKAEVSRWQALLQQGRNLLEEVATAPDVPSHIPFWHKAGLIARAAMVLADHHVSGRDFQQEVDVSSYRAIHIHANSIRNGQRTRLNQPLTWHLEHVGGTAKEYVNFFGPQPLPMLCAKRRHNLHGDGATVPERFVWQDRACAFIRQTRQTYPGPGAFLIFNVASTGAGKTRANVRMLETCRTLDDPLRVTAGFNLKALTLQTATAYRAELGLNSSECACVIGDPLAKALHLYEMQDDDNAPAPETFDSSGCDSHAFLNTLPEWVRALDKDGKGHTNATLVAAPVLAATMDYLIAAGDPTKQAHHAHAMLRIAHSDLLIDEADSYDPHGLVAVLRVIQIAGMFGRNVLISSATLSPVLAGQIWQAWQSGIAMYNADASVALQTHTVLVSNQGEATGRQVLHEPAFMPFLQWYRESMADCYRTAQDLPTHRLCEIAPIANTQSLSERFAEICQTAHTNHGWPAQVDGRTVQVSVGVIRLANVRPLQRQAEQLTRQSWPDGTVVKVCTYHAAEIAMRRYLKEQALDQLLKRHGDLNLSEHPLIAEALAQLRSDANHLILIVLVSPVEEVGRDHDFDWAVIEPSSIHSIIQMAGRVNRHRLVPVSRPNIFVLEWNIKNLKGKPLCFVKPGLQQSDAKGQPTTHLECSAFQLLQPLAQPVASGKADMAAPFALDAGLIFDPQHRCHFAEEDDKAITLILQDTERFFDPHHEQWACDWVYVKYPLRERQHDETWRVEPIIYGQLRIQKYERNHRGSPWVESGDVKEQRLNDETRQWLCPNIEAAEQRLRTQLERQYGFGHPQVNALMQLSRQVSLRKTSERLPSIRWTGVT